MGHGGLYTSVTWFKEKEVRFPGLSHCQTGSKYDFDETSKGCTLLSTLYFFGPCPWTTCNTQPSSGLLRNELNKSYCGGEGVGSCFNRPSSSPKNNSPPHRWLQNKLLSSAILPCDVAALHFLYKTKQQQNTKPNSHFQSSINRKLSGKITRHWITFIHIGFLFIKNII